MKLLVTGATGFVGSVVARQLLARGDEVHVL
ncbi:MAG: NAD-dependent epimerase/dehydratase family protein, partial [Gammaproteobacteria bacterium]|nr:NAD-dependent epimerase/dehydratase family protein [Gammaproteobacteria bacterium]